MSTTFSANKKITVFLEGLLGGGAERTLTNFTNELVTNNYQVELVLFKKEGKFTNQVSKDVKIILLESKSKFEYLTNFVKYLRNHKPDIVLSSLELINFIAIISKYITFSKTKFIIRIENTISLQKRPFPKKLIEKIAVTFLYRYADEIIAVSNGVADDLSKYARIDRDRITTIYNPVIFSGLEQKSFEVPNHPWFETESPPIILSIGRLSQQKNFANLIKAFAIIRESTEARLIILGEGEERQYLEKIINKLNIEDVVDLPGFVENPYAFIRNSAVYALSSDWEGLPTVLIEALACGITAVSTDCPSGPKEILKNGEYGVLIPVNNPEYLAQAILDVLEGKVTKIVPEGWLEQFTVEYSTTKIAALF